jgi:LPS O-antigen subunit length determinant protein (WzzB/FepE family)
LTQLFYTWKHWQNRLPVAIKDNNMVYIKGNPATSSSPINASLIGSNFYQNNLKPFLEQFEKWLREMATNQRAFVPFNLDASELQHMVMNIQQKQKGMLFKSDKWDFKDFDTELNEAEKQTGGLTQEQKFLALFSIATEAIFQDRLQEAMS